MKKILIGLLLMSSLSFSAKIKIFDCMEYSEKDINDFISNKQVINIFYVRGYAYRDRNAFVVVYE